MCFSIGKVVTNKSADLGLNLNGHVRVLVNLDLNTRSLVSCCHRGYYYCYGYGY